MTPLRVLVLEDQQGDADFLIDCLRKAGYEPDWNITATEQTFLSYLNQPFDLILARYDLPGFGALDALRRMQEHDRDIPFIVVAATASEEAAVACMQHGATDYLLRERLARLGTAVAAALEGKRLRDERRQMEAHLRESEERYRQLVELSPDAIVVYNRDAILYINPAGARDLLNEESPAAVIGKPLVDFLHPDFQEWMAQQMDRVAETGVVRNRASITVVSADGRRLELELTSAPIVYQGSPARQVIIRDISERRQAQRALRESEERFRNVFEENPVGMALVGPDMTLQRVNAALCQMLGYRPEDLLNRTFMEFTHPDDVADDLRNAQQLMAGKISSYQMDKRYITSSGAVIWVHLTGVVVRDEGGEPRYGMAIVENITERKLAEDALRESRERYRIITELITDYASSYRQEGDGSITREWITADSFTRMTGYSIEEIESRPVIALYHPDDAQAVQRELDAAWNGTPVHGEYRLLTKNGELRWVSVDRRPIVDERTGRVIRLYGVAQDITARKLAEEELRAHTLRSEALAEISRALAERHRDYRAVLELIVRQISQLLGDACVLTLLTGEAKRVDTVAFYHPDPEARTFMEHLFKSAYGSTKPGIVNHVVELGKPSRVTNVPMEYIRPLVQPEYQPYLDRFGMYSLLVVPLRVQGVVIGTLGVSRDTPDRPYTDVDETFLQDLADRAAQAIENARLFEAVENAREQMRQLAQQVVTVQEEERRRLSRELHDEAGQSLTALKIRLQMLAGAVPADLETVRQSLDEVVKLTDATMHHIRLLAQDLRPPVLDTLDFTTVLASYCRDFARRTRIATDYQGDVLPTLPDTLKTFLYRFLQETLTNVVKHADASQVEVCLNLLPDEVTLMVADNGFGFSPRANGGIGLVGIRERLTLLGGWLEIESAPGEGSRLTAHVPWRRA
jgi:PAS domain S-box-containing protein